MKKKEKPKVKNKELETSLTGKFTEAVKSLGHDTDKLKKEIAKAGKSVSQKITSALKKAQKAEAKAAGKKDKPAGKLLKNKDAKADKVVSKLSKASANAPVVSSRSVAKPVLPAVDKNLIKPDEKTVVKEASATPPVKRRRAPRRKKEEIEAQEKAKKEAVKEASEPVKRKRAPRKPKAITTDEVTPAEVTGSEVDR
ncbi:hypothetical protein [Mucilaginibacter sp.]|uniref:hypothetical protein n=1 Tax=Mucilaginibacter sp. TaxID=1882438 RepID=UPI003B00BD03